MGNPLSPAWEKTGMAFVCSLPVREGTLINRLERGTGKLSVSALSRIKC